MIAASVLAAVAIVGGTVFTGQGEGLENATVLIDGNRIAAVGTGIAIPDDAERIDARGAVVTPGLIDPHTHLGVMDFSRNVPTSVEGTLGGSADPVRAALRVSDTFNPDSVAIPIARGGGITSAIVAPFGGVISGQSIWADLVEQDPVRRRAAALHVTLGANGREPGSRQAAFLRLREALEDARLYRANRGPYIARKLRPLSISAADLEVLDRALERELRVVIEVDRAADIRQALRLVREHRLDAVLLGVREGWLVADEIASAGVSALVEPLADLPTSQDTLESRRDNAVRLHAAGVRVAFTSRGEVHLAHRLRYAAGNAVAEGFPYDAAVAAITRVPAEIFGVTDAGTLRPGTLANVVVWNGDPLDTASWPTHIFIRGQSIDLTTRQDALTRRYRNLGDGP